MGEKILSICKKIYSGMILTAFFAGLLPLLPFIVAMIIGGPTAESICAFLYNDYYPWIIAISAASVLVGLIGMYAGKMIKSEWKKEKKNKIEDSAEVEEDNEVVDTAEAEKSNELQDK